MRTIGMLLGIPEQDQEAIRDQIDDGPAARRGHDARRRPRRRLRRRPSVFADYIDWRAEHPSDDLMTELLNAEFEDETGDRAPAHPRRGPQLRQPARRRRQRDHDPAHRLDRQGARRAPRPARASWSRTASLVPERDRGAAALRGAVAGAGPLRHRTTSSTTAQTVPEGSVMVLLNGVGQPRRAPVPRRRPLRHPPQDRPPPVASATASTSASAPRWPGSRAGSRSTRCCSASPTWEVDWDNAVQAHTSTVRGWEKLPVLVP